MSLPKNCGYSLIWYQIFSNGGFLRVSGCVESEVMLVNSSYLIWFSDLIDSIKSVALSCSLNGHFSVILCHHVLVIWKILLHWVIWIFQMCIRFFKQHHENPFVNFTAHLIRKFSKFGESSLTMAETGFPSFNYLRKAKLLSSASDTARCFSWSSRHTSFWEHSHRACSVVSDSAALWTEHSGSSVRRIFQARILVGCHFLLQVIFPSLHLLHWLEDSLPRRILYHWVTCEALIFGKLSAKYSSVNNRSYSVVILPNKHCVPWKTG